MMKIIDYYETDEKEYWLNQIRKSDWGAGEYLYELLSENKLRELCGDPCKVLLLTDGDELISFCTYVRLDDIRDTELTPWIGFVYTFPEHRGKRRMGILLKHAYELARKDGYSHIYISTDKTGIYEKYGYRFYGMMKDIHGEDSRIYNIDVKDEDEKTG